MVTEEFLPQSLSDDRNGSPPGNSMIAKLPDEIILSIFDFYRQSFRNRHSSERDWNNKNGWFKLSHVCRNWRCIVLSSSSRLRVRLYFTDKTPTMAAALTSLPPLPIIVDYLNRHVVWTVSAQNRLTSALRYPDRVCRIAIAFTPESPNTFFKALDTYFPTLESFEVENRRFRGFDFPPTLMTSTKSLRRLKIGTRLASLAPLLSATTVLTDLTLSIDLVICPRQGMSLPALLQCLPRLRHLNVHSIDIPSVHTIPAKTNDIVSLAELTNFRLLGHSSSVEELLSGLVTPSLQELHATLNRSHAYHEFHFPHLTKLIRNVGMIFVAAQIKLSDWRDYTISLLTHSHFIDDDPPFNIIGNEVPPTVHIVDALSTMLTTVEDVFVAFRRPNMHPELSQVDLTPWYGLFGHLQNVKILRVQFGIETEVAKMLTQGGRQPTVDVTVPEEEEADLYGTILSDMRIDSTQFNLGFLPLLEGIEVHMASPGSLISASGCASALEPFDAFVAARRQAGRPVNVCRNMDQVLPASFRYEWPWPATD